MTGNAVHRGTCRGCSNPVVWADTRDEGRICLDAHETITGPNRFRIDDDVYAVPVAQQAQLLAYPRHDCDPYKIRRRRL